MNTLKLIISDKTHEVTIKEYNGQRVVTLRDVDDLHGRADGTARRTFATQRKHFIEGEDYFVRNTHEAFSEYSVKAPNGLILLTESGYLLLVKTFTDDLAWQVQRQLVKAYFKAKESNQKMVETSQEDILIYALQSQKEMKKELAQLRLVVDNEIFITDHQKAEIQEAVKKRVGYLMKKGYESHFQSIYSALKVFFTVPKYDKILRKDFDEAIDFINGWYPKKAEE